MLACAVHRYQRRNEKMALQPLEREESMQRIGEVADALGECPRWDAAAERIRWIDVTGAKLRSCDLDGGSSTTVELPEYVGSFALRANGGLLMAYRRRIALRDADGTEIAIEVPANVWDGTRERFNDGSCDAKGRFWVGTMDRRLSEAVGCLYRIDPDGQIHRMASGFGLSNGIAWSPDGRTMYQCDSRPPVIYAYDFDRETGAIGERRTFAEFPSEWGMPDGCATDVDGHLWVAAPDAGQIMRFDPAGARERAVATPASRPTSVAFAGSSLETLVVTSMRLHDAPSGPQDGSLYVFEAPAPGLPTHAFAG
jgi:sugar lactone lactonase YvrE